MHSFSMNKKAAWLPVMLLVFAALFLASCKRGGQEQLKARQSTQPQAGAAAPPSASPAEPKILMRQVFENEQVRALEVAWDPKAAVPAAKQEGNQTVGIIGVVLKGGTLEYTDAKGKKTRQERKSGDVFWQAGNTQLEARENVGDTRMNVLQVRVKKAAPTKQYKGAVEGEKTVVENARLAAFDFTLSPGAKLPLHSYAPRGWVILQGGDMRSTDKAGKAQLGSFAAGQFLWLPAAEQSFENIGKTPVRVVSIELK